VVSRLVVFPSASQGKVDEPLLRGRLQVTQDEVIGRQKSE
jgi:hypothetical protein